MDYRQFEDQIRNTFQGDSIPLSAKELNALLPKKDRNAPKAMIFYISGAGIILLGFLYYLMFRQEQGNLLQEKDIPSAIVQTAVVASPIHDENMITSHTPTYLTEEIQTQYVAPPTLSKDINRTKSVNGRITDQESIHEVRISPDIVSSSIEIATEDLPTSDILSNEKFASSQTHIPLLANSVHGLEYNHLPAFTKKVECADFFVGKKIGFSIIPEIGVFYPFKTLKNNTSEPNDILSLRQENEKSLEGLSAALYGRMFFRRKGIYIQSGVSYARLTEKMTLEYDVIKMDTTKGIISTTISPNGDTITSIYGDIITESRFVGSSKVHHTMSLIDIPLIIGYEKPMNGWIVGGDIGVNFNVSLKAKGRILRSDTDFQDINTNPYTYRSRLGLSYRGGIHISRQMTEKGRLYLDLRGTIIPKSFSDNANPIQQSYNFLGAYLGYIIKI